MRAAKNAETLNGFLRLKNVLTDLQENGHDRKKRSTDRVIPNGGYFRASFRYWSGEMPNTDLNTLAK